MSNRHFVFLALSLLTGAGNVGRAQRPSSTQREREAIRITPAQMRAYGRQALAREVATHGLLDNAAANAQVAAILARITKATGHPSLNVEWAITRDTTVNAGMFPGSVMVIHAGLLTKVGEWVREEVPSDGGLRARRFEAYAAAVLAHEVAHATLGHSDSALLEAVREEARKRVRSAVTDDMDAQVRRLLADSAFMSKRRTIRGNEEAADRVGSWYLLRAGWEIQDAMSLMRLFDAWERSMGNSSLATLSWFNDHPRSSTREARLEAFRASLKLRQGEFDDALVLLRNNTMLDSAGMLLDRVLVDFPDLPAVLHARAAVLHRQWLNATPVQQLLVRSSAPTYDARFIEGIRGAAQSPLLTAARRAYAKVLERELLPYTLSNLAVLDAYAGELLVAQARADSAARLAADDPFVQNNRGTVLYLARKYAPARDIFRALARAHDDWTSPQFNLGRSLLALGDSTGARAAFGEYAMSDDESAWGREAVRLLQRLGGAAPPASSASATGGLPSVAGIALGSTRAQVTSVFGAPEERRTAEQGEIWRYPSRGLVVGIARAGTVAFVGLGTRGAGDIDGVRVGDSVQSVRQRWGKPVEDSDGAFVFDRGGWYAIAPYQQGVVLELAAQRK